MVERIISGFRGQLRAILEEEYLSSLNAANLIERVNHVRQKYNERATALMNTYLAEYKDSIYGRDIVDGMLDATNSEESTWLKSKWPDYFPE
jgi:hypothetical protein